MHGYSMHAVIIIIIIIIIIILHDCKSLPETFLQVDWACVDGRRYKTLYCISSMEKFDSYI